MRVPAAVVLAFAAVTVLPLASAAPARASVGQASGSLVDVAVEVDGATTPLYPARDGSGRFYFEARAGGAYAVRVANRSPERLGVVVAVDGLNAISGERETGPASSSPPGRMYVIDPWDEVAVRGWRTSLADVRRFTFVDERLSYAARTGRANGRMGWIEAWVYRESPSAHVARPWPRPWERGSAPEEQAEEARRRAEGSSSEAPASDAAPPPAAAPEGRAADGALQKSQDASRAGGAYPGTGWGRRTEDPAMVVDFHPQLRPAECLTLRYEYAPALRALGLLSPPPWEGDRLRQRDRGEGFARAPGW